MKIAVDELCELAGCNLTNGASLEELAQFQSILPPAGPKHYGFTAVNNEGELVKTTMKVREGGTANSIGESLSREANGLTVTYSQSSTLSCVAEDVEGFFHEFELRHVSSREMRELRQKSHKSVHIVHRFQILIHNSRTGMTNRKYMQMLFKTVTFCRTMRWCQRKFQETKEKHFFANAASHIITMKKL
ncbi:hypothetical protein B566_EDAN011071 [Ephemera danica]|nr:hypothetical protein B566_EDAN011071 [Ephemera danica]